VGGWEKGGMANRRYANVQEYVIVAIACINMNRNYIGFELDKHYCEIANERIEKTLAEKVVSE